MNALDYDRNESATITKGETILGRCFVIQPFDKGPFDDRFQEVFAPAIRAAELEPYRVDEDPKVQIPIEDIQREIRSAEVCLVDITTDNPNVWFELGFAIASNKPVVLVCSVSRTSKYPFDIQHRTVISYRTESPKDFSKLQKDITARLSALERAQAMQIAIEEAPLVPRSGLESYEISVLGYLLANRMTPGASCTPFEIQSSMRRWGYTDAATALALEDLQLANMIELVETHGYQNDPYEAYRLLDEGLAWLRNNRHMLTLQRQRSDVEEEPPSGDYDPFAE